MVFALYTLMEQYRNKKKYIWNVNRDSIGIFTKAVFSGVDIQGFVVEEKKDNDDIYMNRPVITKKELSGEEELIII